VASNHLAGECASRRELRGAQDRMDPDQKRTPLWGADPIAGAFEGGEEEGGGDSRAPRLPHSEPGWPLGRLSLGAAMSGPGWAHVHIDHAIQGPDVVALHLGDVEAIEVGPRRHCVRPHAGEHHPVPSLEEGHGDVSSDNV
jgi:hypothetical protein